MPDIYCEDLSAALVRDAVLPRISVVIPAYNLERTIRATLACLELQDLPPHRFECLFIDDGSSDHLTEIVQQWRPPFEHRVLRNALNIGRSASRNRGWREARGDVIVFLDGDMLPHPSLLATYERQFATRAVDVVSGRRAHLNLIQEGPRLEDVVRGVAARRTDGRPSAESIMRLFAQAHLGQVPTEGQRQLELEMAEICERFPKSLTRALSFITANCAVTRSMLERTTGFSELCTRGEDTELGIRLALCGARFRYAADACALHVFQGRYDADPFDLALKMLVHRHPYLAVVAWFVWATRHPFLPSLLGVARSEGDPTFDKETLLQIAEPLGLSRSFWVDEKGLRAYEGEQSGRRRWGERLLSAVAAGVIHEERDGQKCFDHDLLMTWVRQGEYAASGNSQNSLAQQTPTCRFTPEAYRAERAQICSGRYEVRVPVEVLPSDRRTVINLAVPVETSRQTQISFTGSFPDDLLQYRQGGLVVGYPVDSSQSGSLDFGFNFRCRLRSSVPAIEDEQTSLRFLVPTSPLRIRADLERLLRMILPEHTIAPEARISRIHAWLLQELWRDPVAVSSYYTAQAGRGPAAELADLFVNLCQLAGVPARVSLGAKLVLENGERCTRRRDYRSPFLRPGAQVWLAARGWLDMDLDEGLTTDFEWCAFAGCTRTAESGGRFARERIDASIFARRLPTLAARYDQWRPVETGLSVTHMLTATFEDADGLELDLL